MFNLLTLLSAAPVCAEMFSDINSYNFVIESTDAANGLFLRSHKIPTGENTEDFELVYGIDPYATEDDVYFFYNQTSGEVLNDLLPRNETAQATFIDTLNNTALTPVVQDGYFTYNGSSEFYGKNVTFEEYFYTYQIYTTNDNNDPELVPLKFKAVDGGPLLSEESEDSKNYNFRNLTAIVEVDDPKVESITLGGIITFYLNVGPTLGSGQSQFVVDEVTNDVYIAASDNTSFLVPGFELGALQFTNTNISALKFENDYLTYNGSSTFALLTEYSNAPEGFITYAGHEDASDFTFKIRGVPGRKVSPTDEHMKDMYVTYFLVEEDDEDVDVEDSEDVDVEDSEDDVTATGTDDSDSTTTEDLDSLPTDVDNDVWDQYLSKISSEQGLIYMPYILV